MKNSSGLVNILVDFWQMNKARAKCFAEALLGLFVVRTVNLSELAVGVASAAQVRSRYRRLQRFFAEVSLDASQIAKLIFQWFFANSKGLYLILDRTNWQWGKAKINIFTLAIAYEGIAVPVFWQVLSKGGTLKGVEQKELLVHFINAFDKNRIAGVIADREFANTTFFSWLEQEQIPFYIRIKSEADVSILKIKGCHRSWSAKKLFAHLHNKKTTVYINYVYVHHTKVRLAAARSEGGELLIVATNQKPDNAVAIYIRRWEIENLFQSLKSRGFRFEATHLTKQERIEKLLALLAIGFCWAHKIGEWHAQIKPIRFNKHHDLLRTSWRPQNSYFRYGLDLIRDAILHGYHRLRSFIKLLILPKPSREGFV